MMNEESVSGEREKGKERRGKHGAKEMCGRG